MAGNVGGLRALVEFLLANPAAGLKAGTRPAPRSLEEFGRQADLAGITVDRYRPRATLPGMLTADDRLVVNMPATMKRADKTGSTAGKVSYKIDRFDPGHVDRAVANGEASLGIIPPEANSDPMWMEHFVRNGPEDQMLSSIDAMGSGNATRGTGDQIYPWVYDLLGLHGDRNIVTMLTNDNVARHPLQNARQMLRYKGSGMDWTQHMAYPYDYHIDPVAASMAPEGDALEHLLSTFRTGAEHRAGVATRMRAANRQRFTGALDDPWKDDIQKRQAEAALKMFGAEDERLKGLGIADPWSAEGLIYNTAPTPEVARFLQQAGAPQMGERTIDLLRAIRNVERGSAPEAAGFPGLKRGGLAAVARPPRTRGKP